MSSQARRWLEMDRTSVYRIVKNLLPSRMAWPATFTLVLVVMVSACVCNVGEVAK